VPRRVTYVPKHRADPSANAGSRVRRTVLFSGAAVCATGMALSSGVVLQGGAGPGTASAELASAKVPHGASDGSGFAGVGDRAVQVSRSMSRTAVDPAKAKVLDQKSGGQVTRTEDLTNRDPRTIARAMLPQFGFSADQFSCLDSIYTSESGWNPHADNPTSSAYGIPQALPGSKMASAGPDWANNPATQIRWGLSYIKSKYGSPCGALSFREGHGWY
jgi:hypothetical protein